MIRSSRFALLLIVLAHASALGLCPSPCNNLGVSRCAERPMICPPCDPCECKATSQTFFSTRPQFQVNSPEYLALFRDRMSARDDGTHGGVQVAVFGGRSSNCGKLATYFLPTCATELRVREDTSITKGTDVLARHFNVVTRNGDFESTISFAPRQSVAGLHFAYHQRLNNDEKNIGYWFALAAPLTRVSTTMGFTEIIINDGGGVAPSDPLAGDFAANMEQGLSQEKFSCGRIDPCASLSRTRLADIDIRCGRELVNTDCCYADTYIGVLAPTGNKVGQSNCDPDFCSPCDTPHNLSSYAFEPIVGHNHHVGFNFGSNIRMTPWVSDDLESCLEIALDIHGLYLFQNTQKRLLELKNKPWSRYMQFYANREQAQEAADNANQYLHTPGTNILCQYVCVRPGFQRTINTAVLLTHKHLQGELGYNFFCRQGECVELATCWQEGPALKSLASITGQTDTVQKIDSVLGDSNTESLANYEKNIITRNDLDLDAAAHPCMITHTIYGSVGYHWDERDYPTFAGLGASYEFSPDNTGMNRWLLWGKAGISF